MSENGRYSDGDREDLEWEEIFSGTADIRALKLPPTIENDLDNFVDTAVAQPDTAFKACEQLTAPSQPSNCLHILHCHTDLRLMHCAKIEGRYGSNRAPVPYRMESHHKGVQCLCTQAMVA